MKRIFPAVGVVLIVGVAWFLINSRRVPTPESESTPVRLSPAAGASSATTNSAANSAVLATSVTEQNQTLASRAGQYIPDTNIPTNLPPEIVLQNLHHIVHQYGEMFGGNPVGTNPEITAALAGKNPKQINFLNGQPGVRLSQNGELLDPWGTPYFFHQLSGTDMEIHSAGPDKIMWTSDDLVTR